MNEVSDAKFVTSLYRFLFECWRREYDINEIQSNYFGKLCNENPFLMKCFCVVFVTPIDVCNFDEIARFFLYDSYKEVKTLCLSFY